jgi:hypothetical protein
MRGRTKGGGRKGEGKDWERGRGNDFIYLGRSNRELCFISHLSNISFYRHGNEAKSFYQESYHDYETAKSGERVKKASKRVERDGHEQKAKTESVKD